MELSDMILEMDSSQEETFRLLAHYFAVRHEETLVSNSPSYVKAKVRTVLSPFSDGKAEATITKRNGGSYVNINFDFRRGYAEASLLAIAIFVLPILSSITYFTPSNSYESGGIFLVALALFIGAIAFEGYIVSLTKKGFIQELRLINEFIKFAQPLPPPPAS
jgi:hypothetical protein